jgi:hypothetical protein
MLVCSARAACQPDNSPISASAAPRTVHHVQQDVPQQEHPWQLQHPTVEGKVSFPLRQPKNGSSGMAAKHTQFLQLRVWAPLAAP